MTCNTCGSRIPENSRFCPECGAPISSAQQQNANSFSQNDTYYDYNNIQNNPYYSSQYDSGDNRYDDYPEGGNYDYEPTEEKKQSKSLIGVVAGLAAAVIILLIVLLIIIFTGRNSDKTKPDPTSTSPTASDSLSAGASQSAVTPSGSTAPSVSATAPSVSGTAPTGSAAAGVLTPGQYKVNTKQDNLNIRKGAGTTHEIIGQIPKDTVVTVTAVNGEWGYVTYGGVSGWVSAQFLAPVIS